MSPRKPQGLPYLQPNRVGRLSYVRRIAPELQSFAGDRKVIRRSLELSSTNQAEPAVIQAWNQVHREAEELIRQAKAAQAGRLLTERPQVPLTSRKRAGIAAETWRQMLAMVDNGTAKPETLARMVPVVR